MTLSQAQVGCRERTLGTTKGNLASGSPAWPRLLLRLCVLFLPISEYSGVAVASGIGTGVLLSGLMLSYHLLRMMRTRRVIRPPLWAILWSLMILVGVVSAAVSHDGLLSVNASARRWIGRIVLLPLSVYWTVRALPEPQRATEWRVTQRIALVIAAVGVLISFGQVVQADIGISPFGRPEVFGGRPTGLSDAPGRWATFLLVPLATVLLRFMDSKKPVDAALFGLLATGIWITGSRSALLGATVAITAAVALRLPRMYGVAFLCLAVVTATIAGLVMVEPIVGYMSSESLTSDHMRQSR